MNLLRPLLLAILGAFSAAAPAAPVAVARPDEGDKYTDSLDQTHKSEKPRPAAAIDATERGDAPRQPSADDIGGAAAATDVAPRPSFREAPVRALRGTDFHGAPSIHDVRAGLCDLPPPRD